MKQALGILAFIVVIIVAVGVGGAILFGSGLGAGNSRDGGVFQTADRGETWIQKTKIFGGGSLAGVEATHMAISPARPPTIYLGTLGQGLWRSTSSAEDWTQVVSGQTLTNRSEITALALDPANPLLFYVGVRRSGAGELERTTDGGATFEAVFIPARTSTTIVGVVVDPSRPERIYIATSDGGILVSENRATTWRALRWFGSAVELARLAPDGTLWIALRSSGLFRSKDRGSTWEDMSAKIGDAIRSFAFDPNRPGTIYAGTNRGLKRSSDNGDTWPDVSLIVPPQALPMTAIALPLSDPQTLYVGGGNFVFKSSDGGLTWQSVRLPTSRRIVALVADPTRDGTLFLGLARGERRLLFGS
ncbi:hypothetical protein HYW68_01530 [Candidatus Parcubacteria bacterium]|nr:hypothetical protein [Candidatus Parcubacteria bacterium]